MVLHCLLENDCKRSQLSSSSVSLFAKLCARNFTSSIVIYKTKWCWSIIVPLQLHTWVSQVHLPSHIQSDWLLPSLFFTSITQGDFSTATFYRKQFLEHSKRYFCIQYWFYFCIQFLVFRHHDLVTHVYSKRIASGCQEQTVYRIWRMSYLVTLNMLSHTLPLPNFTCEHSFLGLLWELEANLSKRRLSKVEHSFF